jgi:hypothetical protein
MADTTKPSENKLLSCEICLKEIPASAANSEEVDEYFYYFCGSDCYKEWQQQSKKDED